MGTLSHPHVANSQQAGAVLGIGSAEMGTASGILRDVAKRLSPQKTWAYLMFVLGLDERAAKHRVALTRRFSADDFLRLLRTGDGREYLIAAMAGCQEQWWLDFERTIALSRLRKQQEDARIRLIELEKSL